jgi:3-hydroxyisobutyrate dehydrogenase-like beta-hydroxyacid dehydrogenase
MMHIGLIGLGHMGFPLARRRRSGKGTLAMMVKDVRLYLDEAKRSVCRSRSPKPSRDSGKPH